MAVIVGVVVWRSGEWRQPAAAATRRYDTTALFDTATVDGQKRSNTLFDLSVIKLEIRI